MRRRQFLAAAPLVPAVLKGQPESGFVSLFDGRSLDGWSIREGPESAFYVSGGEIVVHEGSGFPTWLRSARQYENFDFRCEFFIKGWIDAGIFLHAPEHGRNTETGFCIKIFHKQDEKMLPESIGAVFPLVPPLKVNVRNQGEWNTMRIVMDWPSLKVWINDALVQDLNLESNPELRYRLRSGYLGIESLSYPIRFRNLRFKELPSKEKWEILYEKPEDFAKWRITDGKPKFEALGGVIRGDGAGHLGTIEKYRDFELHLYLRSAKHANGGILFRHQQPELGTRGTHYEIQVHDVEGAVYPTGSLYHYKRAIYPRIEPEKWFLFQLVVKDRFCLVRINGENVMEYHDLDNVEPGPIMLQAHRPGWWIEYKQIRIKRI
ncbi:MAG: DUF1080 domain-containing protein [Bryobacteraceae bacterium]